VAFARHRGNTVIILDLLSGDSLLKISMDGKAEVFGLGMTGSTIAVVCRTKPTSREVMVKPLSRGGVFGTTQMRLEIYDASNGRKLADAAISEEATNDIGMKLLFTQDGREIQVFESQGSWRPVGRWEITKSGPSGATRLQRSLEKTPWPRGAFYSSPSYGHTVTDDWWVLSPSQKPLLWLPHRWRSHRGHIRWAGRFLGLSPVELIREVVILEFLS